jgi:hypothetical protein
MICAADPPRRLKPRIEPKRRDAALFFGRRCISQPSARSVERTDDEPCFIGAVRKQANQPPHNPVTPKERDIIMTIVKSLPSLLAAAALCAISAGVAAQTIDIKCETRSNRSKASVDGKNLVPANYSAVLTSGSNEAQSPYQASIGDEAEFDFDSNRGDIADGATPISPNFIKRNRVKAAILDVNGNVVVRGSAICRQR